ncbi:MAG: hypothetical protein CR988_00275 [Treponema sp.]|nr:MAG: hypothetical protein CR988_00275 [Treponema sp.]
MLWFFVLLLLYSENGENKYGKNPKSCDETKEHTEFNGVKEDVKKAEDKKTKDDNEITENAYQTFKEDLLDKFFQQI